MVDLKKMLQIVEGGFNTQEINSAFDYDIVSSEDESVISSISSSDESESGSENEDISVIPPTPKKRKINEFVEISNSKMFTTCTKHVHQHVQGASGSNQSNSGICDLSAQHSLNTVSTDNTSPHQVTSQLDPTIEHDEVSVLNTQTVPVFFIPLDTEVTPEKHHEEESTFQLQQNQLSEQKTTTIQTPTIPVDQSPSWLPHPPCNERK